MKSRGSIYDVAKEAGVSVSTVSRVFNRHPDVADDTKAGVMSAAKHVNYMPRVTSRRVTIGVVVQYIEPSHDVGFVSQLLSALARRMARFGSVLELVPIDDLEMVFRHYLRGLIAITYGPESGMLGEIEHIPVVLINNRIDHPNFHYVASDHAQGARLAVQHLVDRGHRRIGFLEVRKVVWGARERERGYREVLAEAGIAVDPKLICYCEDDPARHAVLQLWEQRPTAILVCGEDLSLAANAVLMQELQLRIPEDISVITYEMPLVSSILTPPQTTILQPWEEISRLAVEGMFSLISGSSQHQLNGLLPNSLVDRHSVATIS